MTADDDFDDEAPAPARRPRPFVALPAEPIPPEINETFLDDLVFERALSTALGLTLA